MKQTKNKHGGARPGSGRPARETPREALTIRIEPEQAEKFRQICQARSISQATQLTNWIKKTKL